MTSSTTSAPKTDDEIQPKNDAATLRKDINAKLFFELAKFPDVATRNDYYLAVAYAIRDRLLYRWIGSSRTYYSGKHRSVVYLSAEYLIGPQLGASLLTLGIADRSVRRWRPPVSISTI